MKQSREVVTNTATTNVSDSSAGASVTVAAGVTHSMTRHSCKGYRCPRLEVREKWRRVHGANVDNSGVLAQNGED